MKSQKEKQPSAFARLMSYAGNYRFATYLGLALSAVSAILMLMPFVYLWKIIREVLTVYPNVREAEGLVHNGWMAVLFSLIGMLVYFAGLMCTHVAAFRTAGNMKRALLSHIAKLPIGFADEMGSGKVRRIVTDSTAATENLLAHNLPDMAAVLTTTVCMIVFLFVYDWRFGLICLVPVVLGFMAMSKMAGQSMAEDMRLYQNALEMMSNEAVEYVRGIPVVKTFGQTVFSFQRFRKSIDDYGKFCMHYTKSCRSPMLTFTVLINSAFAFLLALALLLIRGGNYADDVLINFLFYVLFTPLITTTMNRVMFLSENMMKIDDTVSRVESIMNLSPLAETDAAAQRSGTEVVFCDVSYRYEDDKPDAVSHLSLVAKPNEITALVGPSGGGKTTVAGLLSRFFDPQSGTVTIGGADVRAIPKTELMNTVSYVFQDSRLLDRTIAENLRVAKPDATEEEMRIALEKAQCNEILARLPDGLSTVLGSKGTYLSGGEKQRIAIARAFLKDAPIVVLDEASAFADPECEMEVQKAFTNLAKDRTVIMIAHRLHSIMNADRIYVLQNGSIAEDGRHEELLSRNGLYAAMWSEYQTSVNWKVA